MATDRSLSVLRLFTLETPAWTVEQIARTLEVSMSTAYRYVLALEEVGLVAASGGGYYILGPAILQLDRQIQLTDPLLLSARPVMNRLAGYAPDGSVVLLCRAFADTVLCIHQVHTKGPQSLISYERGRPMPLLRGATSRIILAHEPTRRLKRLYERHQEALRSSGMADSWEQFRSQQSQLRKTGYAVSFGEIDPDRIGIAVALLGEARQPIGSLSFVLPGSAGQEHIPILASVLATGSRDIAAGMQSSGEDEGRRASA